jgi:hypothetical protein
VLTREEENHDVDHYKKGEKIIFFKVEASPQVETSQWLVMRKNQQSH